MTTDPTLIELLYAALDTPLGVAVKTNNPERLRQKLYALRKGDTALEELKLSPSPFDPLGELWIVRKDAKESGQNTARTTYAEPL